MPPATSPTAASPTERVIRAIAEQTGTSPLKLTPLYSVLDPDALDDLIRSVGDERTVVQFQYCGYTVRITGDGSVDLTPVES